MFCCDPMLFISAIFEISSMLVETENLLFSRSSTWAIMTDDVRWAYFFCHEYVSSDNSFFKSLLAGLFAAAGLKSESIFIIMAIRKSFLYVFEFSPSTSLAGAEYVGSLMYCAGELCKQIIGNDGLSVKCTRILEHSKEISNRVNWTWSCRDVKANPRNVSHTIIVLSSLPETAVVPSLNIYQEGKEHFISSEIEGKVRALPSAETLTQVTGPRCPANVCISSPVCRSQTIKLQSFEPDITWLLLVTETATVRTASEWPTSTFKKFSFW